VEIFAKLIENKPMNSRDLSQQILAKAGIEINGSQPWDIQIKNEKIWDRIISQRQLGLAESYMDGWWECAAIDVFLTKLLSVDATSFLKISPSLIFHTLKSTTLNRQTKKRAAANAKHHYNIGNDLYSRMLDPEMIYSCAYWKDAKDLNSAQIAKLDLICRKLELKPGMRLLDIGSGWGALLRYAVKNYGVIGVGISPADNQISLARERSSGLDIEFKQMDYRDLTGEFDRIVSVGMMEHVGPKNLKTFFQKCNELLVSDGMMLHHTIGSNVTKLTTDPFFDRYIFPGGVLPSIAQVSSSIEKIFTIEDLQNFGPYYDLTLLEWYKNINAKWQEIPNYDERFIRMWNYYLLSSAAGFRAGHIQLFQFVMRRIGERNTYIAPR
jgi:cyclopropane-fatty-acyl-phospholipid synthase